MNIRLVGGLIVVIPTDQLFEQPLPLEMSAAASLLFKSARTSTQVTSGCARYYSYVLSTCVLNFLPPYLYVIYHHFICSQIW